MVSFRHPSPFLSRSAAPLALAALVLGAASGCVSKRDLEEAHAQLAACEDERTRAEASVIAWEARFDRENQRWDELEASVTEALPGALAEFHDERDRILELVPDQVKTEVSTYLDDYFGTVMKGFEQLKNDNAGIQMQLEATRQALETVGSDTRSIGDSIDQNLAAEQTRRQNIGVQLADVVSQLGNFDRTRIQCKDCDDRLRLNRKEREAISGFHSELTEALVRIQTMASHGQSSPDAGDEPSEEPGTLPAADGEGQTG